MTETAITADASASSVVMVGNTEARMDAMNTAILRMVSAKCEYVPSTIYWMYAYVRGKKQRDEINR